MEKICNGEKETEQLAFDFAKQLKGGEVIVLSGNLGAGKTTFTKFLAKALGIKEIVTSPTFTIMNEYSSGRLKLYHFDMYRIEDESEVLELGLTDFFSSDGICVIEWAENIKSLVPSKHIRIKINKISDDSRKFSIKGAL